MVEAVRMSCLNYKKLFNCSLVQRLIKLKSEDDLLQWTRSNLSGTLNQTFFLSSPFKLSIPPAVLLSLVYWLPGALNNQTWALVVADLMSWHNPPLVLSSLILESRFIGWPASECEEGGCAEMNRAQMASVLGSTGVGGGGGYQIVNSIVLALLQGAWRYVRMINVSHTADFMNNTNN